MRTGAGTLRDRITVERKASTDNGRGGTSQTWSAILTAVPARVTVKRGGEAVQAQRLAGTTPYEIVVRYNDSTAGITSADRVRTSAGEALAVRWVGTLDEGRARWLLLVCEAGTVAGA